MVMDFNIEKYKIKIWTADRKKMLILIEDTKKLQLNGFRY